MQVEYIQQDRKHLSLCVSKNYRDLYFFFVKNKICRQLDLLSRNDVISLKLEQSNISETCYIYLYISNVKNPKVVKISSHYSNSFSDYDFNLDLKDIASGFHFNNLNLNLIKTT